MGHKVSLKYSNGDGATLELSSSGQVLAKDVKLFDPGEGPVLFEIIKKLIPWMAKNSVSSIEVEQED